MTDSPKPQRIRSPSYPYFSLTVAIDRVRKMEKIAKRSEVMISFMLPHWGFQTGKSANGMKAVAAMKNFGLIQDSGIKDQRKISITDKAYSIIHGVKDSEAWNSVVKEVALLPVMYQYMWETYGEVDNMPQDDVIKSQLILDKKFNEGAVRGFLSDYKETIRYAKLGSNDKIEAQDQVVDDADADETNHKISVGDFIQWTSSDVDQLPKPAQVMGFSDDGNYLYIDPDITATGIPVNEASIVEKSDLKTPPPNPFIGQSSKDSAIEKENGEVTFMQNTYPDRDGNDLSFRILVKGKMGKVEIGNLIEILQLQQKFHQD